MVMIEKDMVTTVTMLMVMVMMVDGDEDEFGENNGDSW